MVTTGEKCPEECALSEWSEWSDCTDKCNGVSKRFRTYFGSNCNVNNTKISEDLEQSRYCNSSCQCEIANPNLSGYPFTYEVIYAFFSHFFIGYIIFFLSDNLSRSV